MGRFVEKAEREFALVAMFAQRAFESLEFLKDFPFFCQLSSINSAKQIVVAIEVKDFERLKTIATNCHCIKLNTQIPFHSSLMLDIVEEFEQELEAVAFKKPAFPVISNVSAAPIEAEEAKQDLLAHLHQPVRFQESIQCILAMGIDKFCDIGPSKIFSLSTMTPREAVKEAARIMYDVHNASKDKEMELEITWICQESAWKHEFVPRELMQEAESYAKSSLEEKMQE